MWYDMSDIVIRAENLGKQYRLGQRERYSTLRDTLVETVKAPWRWLASRASGNGEPAQAETIWAVRDVSFEVTRGEVVGIIGRNGAGKSTLLKILSQITEPTTGMADLAGRIGSLLEVGSGFHQELTGRENIFLNGAILGMSRRETKARFDDIIGFAEVDAFIDTPVKHYSSGMYMRLAFAVAAHLETDILIVDEVLAVGDDAFQKKCLGKMSQVTKSGRTVLFVSHNMNTMRRLCSRVIYLDGGKIGYDGDAADCIQRYLTVQADRAGAQDLAANTNRGGTGEARFVRIELLNLDGAPRGEFCFGEPFRVRITIQAKVEMNDPVIGFWFMSADGTELHGSIVHDGGVRCHLLPGSQMFECVIEPMVLTPGRYSIRGLILRAGETCDQIEDMTQFEVLNIHHPGAITPQNYWFGHVYIPYRWSQIPTETTT
jgi:lipopolysaccharide transport system ATP-binding protein